MNDSVDAFDGFIKSSGSGDVLYDGKGETAVVTLQEVGVRVADLVGGGLTANGATDFVAML